MVIEVDQFDIVIDLYSFILFLIGEKTKKKGIKMICLAFVVATY